MTVQYRGATGHPGETPDPDGPIPPAIEFALPPALEAREPAEVRAGGRDKVALMVSRRATGQISHHAFADLPGLLLPGDLILVNTSGTLPAAIPLGDGLTVHFSSAMPDGDWLVELRQASGRTTAPYGGGHPGDELELPGGARLTLTARFSGRLWRARLSTAVVPYLLRRGTPIRYSYVDRAWPTAAYQTVFATRPGSAEMPSASRPFTPEIVTGLVARGVTLAPLTLDTGVSSLEGDEDPYPEHYEVTPATARLINLTRRSGGRIIAAGSTAVRAAESAALAAGRDGRDGLVAAATGWTEHVVTPDTGLRVVDGLLTGLHEPRSSHLRMLAAFAGRELLARCYEQALDRGYLWHEFGDVHLLL